MRQLACARTNNAHILCSVCFLCRQRGARLCDPHLVYPPNEVRVLFSLLIAIIWDFDDFSSRLEEPRMAGVKNAARGKRQDPRSPRLRRQQSFN